MARVRITYWRDIPVLVTAREGADGASVPLSQRFQDLVDGVAMQDGLAAAEEYLAQWRAGLEEERPGAPEAVARAVAAELEARFGEIRLRSLRPSADS